MDVGVGPKWNLISRLVLKLCEIKKSMAKLLTNSSRFNTLALGSISRIAIQELKIQQFKNLIVDKGH